MTTPHTAHKCFDENVRLFANAKAQPEKFNLYNGLAALATTLGRIEERLDAIERRLQVLERR